MSSSFCFGCSIKRLGSHERESDAMVLDLYVLDWSGTVSDDRIPVYVSNMKILGLYGKPTMSFEEWLSGSAMTAVEFLNNHGVNGDPDKLFALYKKHLDMAIEEGHKPLPYADAHETLEYLKKEGRKIAVLSSHPEENLRAEAEIYSLSCFIDMIAGNSRDKVAGIADVCSKFGVKKESSIYVGDTIYDIRSAKDAGTLSAGVCAGYHARERLEKEKPDFLLSKLSDLKSVHLMT